jgi:hypothetical protein
MKKIQLLFLSLAFVFFTSCEKESNSENGNGSPISADSELTDLLLRVSKTATSSRSDDTKPEKDCFKIKLPAKFEFDGSEFEIKDQAYYEKLNNALQAYIKDVKAATFGFPMTIIVDGTEVTVKNSDELKEIIKKCHKYDDDDAIDEVKINYPITISLTDREGVKKDIVINSDNELKTFIKSLDKTSLITLNYPISLTNKKGEVITVNSNEELRDLLLSTIKKEIDDIKAEMYTDMITQFIAAGSFDVKIQNELYKVTFNADGTASVTNAKGLKAMGSWEFELKEGKSKLKLKFDNQELKILNQDFLIKQCNYINFLLVGKDDNGAVIQVFFSKSLK